MTVAIPRPLFGACLALALTIPVAVTAADAPLLHPDQGAQTYRSSHRQPATPCVSGPNTGAMGVHFVLPERLGDAAVYADAPEALIYEPQPDGAMRLVGVEFILFASNWAATHPEGGAPKLEGHLMNYVGAPNRYGLDAFYELHVWAWEDNPEGSFADWNTRVTCENQALD